jgi:hypothetical protein
MEKELPQRKLLTNEPGSCPAFLFIFIIHL